MKKISVIILIFALSFFLLTCNSLNDQNTATVTINTGIGASKATAPNDVTSISVSVSGEGMAAMTKSIPIDTGIRTFEVPVGPARLFTVTAAAGNFIYLGSDSRDIPETGEVNISITMVIQAGILDFPNQFDYIGTTESFTVNITISETGGSVEYTFPPDDTSPKYVPTGNNRVITITATPLSQSAVVSFSTESTTANFLNGEYTVVSLLPSVTETKLVIPDFWFQWSPGRGRLVQMDDINGVNWIEKDAYDLGIDILATNDLYPYDIDFDRAGRFYLAHNEGGTSGARLYRLNTINDTSATQLYDGLDGVQAITIDRNNNLIYFSTPSSLNRCNDCDCSSIDTLSKVSTIQDIYGLAVDDDGLLYISGTNGSGMDRVFKYNPLTETILAEYPTVGTIDEARDVIVKNTYLYVANYDSFTTGNKIIQLNLGDLTEVTTMGSGIGSGRVGTEEFLGPQRFVAILNSRFYLIDDLWNDNEDNEGLITFEDMSATGWDTYYPSDDSRSPFRFYYDC